jgi:hypothetical protein
MRVSKGKGDVHVINGDGTSALHLVIVSDNARSLEMFETLLKTGPDVNVVRRDGASALALAIVSGNARILNFHMMTKMIEYDESAEIFLCAPPVSGLFRTKQHFSLAQRRAITT